MLVIGVLTMLTPFVWMFSASFKQEVEILSYPPTLWPDPWTLENYQYVFKTLGYMRFVLNSLIVVTFTISGHVISGSLVAFGFARMRFPGRNVLFFLVLSTMMIPFHAYMIPRFIIMRHLHLLDTLAAVFLPYLFGGAFYIFLCASTSCRFPLSWTMPPVSTAATVSRSTPASPCRWPSR